LIPEEELKRKMTDDVCGCSVSEKEEEESKYADSHIIFGVKPLSKTRSRRKMRPPSSFSRVDVDDELMIVNVETLRQSRPQHYFFEAHLVILNIYHQNRANVCNSYRGENLNEIYSILVFRISLGNLTNFSFIESSRLALNSTTEAAGKKHSYRSSQSLKRYFYLLFFFVA